MKKQIFLLLILISFLFSCTVDTEIVDQPVAKVYDKYLYVSDLQQIIPQKISPQDSEALANRFIQDWIKKQLLLKKAELNLTKKDKDVDKLLDDYRTSLLIFRYQQEYLKTKLDTNFEQKEIETYYNLHSSDFKLKANIICGIYVKISRDDNNLENIKQWARNNNNQYYNKLQDYCSKRAAKFILFDKEWMYFDQILGEIKTDIGDQSEFLKKEKTIDYLDSVYRYFVFIKDYKLRDEPAPVNMAASDIKNILINKNKIKVFDELQTNLYQDALSHSHLELFKNTK